MTGIWVGFWLGAVAGIVLLLLFPVRKRRQKMTVAFKRHWWERPW